MILHEELSVIKKAQEVIANWLKGMGLELKPTKTKISHTLCEYNGNVGFDFLGFNVRQYKVSKYSSGKTMKGYKTLIKPSKDKVKRHLRQVGEVIDKNKGTPQEALIGKLNPIIRGWCNYYSTVISTKIFASVNHFTYEKLRAWAKRRHPNENAHQISNKYWLIGQGGGWTFAARKEEKTYKLLKHNEVPIIRHIKVEGYRTPYDGDWSYWATRTGKHPQLPNKVAKLLNQQKGKCQYCGLYFTPESLMEVHHLDENHKNQKWNNLALVHRHCHDQIHGIQNHDIGNQVLETDFLVENLF